MNFKTLSLLLSASLCLLVSPSFPPTPLSLPLSLCLRVSPSLLPLSLPPPPSSHPASLSLSIPVSLPFVLRCPCAVDGMLKSKSEFSLSPPPPPTPTSLSPSLSIPLSPSVCLSLSVSLSLPPPLPPALSSASPCVTQRTLVEAGKQKRPVRVFATSKREHSVEILFLSLKLRFLWKKLTCFPEPRPNHRPACQWLSMVVLSERFVKSESCNTTRAATFRR